MRVKGGYTTRQRRKRVLKAAKGFYGARSKLYNIAAEAVRRKWAYAYSGRKKKKGDFRKLWILRINAKVREFGLSYSKFIHGLKLLNLDLDRKILSDMAVNDATGFSILVDRVKAAK